jgi:hypothetical protein
MQKITVELDQEFRRATATGLNRRLSVTCAGRYHRFTLPSLKAYEVVALE